MSERSAQRIKNLAEKQTIGQPERVTHDHAKKMRKQYRKLNHKQKGDFLRKMGV